MRAEAAVRDSEERFRLAFAAASLGIVVVALDGTIQQCNPAFRAMVGGDCLEGSSVFDFIGDDVIPSAERLPARRSFCFDATALPPTGASGTGGSPAPASPPRRRRQAPSLLFLIEDITDAVRAAPSAASSNWRCRTATSWRRWAGWPAASRTSSTTCWARS